MSAVRLARAVTGREVVVKFAGAYHGHSDGLLAEAGSGLATLAIPASPGVPAAQTAGTVVVPWNDRRCGRPRARRPSGRRARGGAAAGQHGGRAGRARLPRVPARGDAGRRRAAGLRRGDQRLPRRPGGAQELYGIEPDLTVMGKVLGGGLPAAAFGGPAATMERIAPAGDVYQAGTLSGNPLAVAAGLATLRRLDADAYARLAASTERLATGLRELAGESAAAGRFGAGPAHAVLQHRAGDRLRRRRGLRPRGPRALLPRDARARRLPASLAVRGLVRLARPRRGGDRAHARSSGRVAGGGAARERARRPRGSASRGGHADLPARGRAGRGRRPTFQPTTTTCSRQSARATSSTTAARACSRGHDDDLALLAGDYLYALGIERLAQLGDTDAVLAPGRPDQHLRPAPHRGQGGAAFRPLAVKRSRPLGRGPPGRAGTTRLPHLAVPDQRARHLLAAGEAEVRPRERVDGAGKAGRRCAAGADEAVLPALVGVDATQLHVEVRHVGPLARRPSARTSRSACRRSPSSATTLKVRTKADGGLLPVDLGEQATVPAGARRVEDQHRPLEGEGRLVGEVDPHLDVPAADDRAAADPLRRGDRRRLDPPHLAGRQPAVEDLAVLVDPDRDLPQLRRRVAFVGGGEAAVDCDRDRRRARAGQRVRRDAAVEGDDQVAVDFLLGLGAAGRAERDEREPARSGASRLHRAR